MKKTIFALALLVVLSLTACGTSNSAALQQENEDLRQQIAALESENAALNDTAPESGDEESNPIDRLFDSVDSGSSTVEAECRNVAAWLKEQLPLQEDKDLVDAYIAAAEAQADRMNVMAIYPIADLTIPQTDRVATSGTLRGVLWAGAYQQIWKDTFYQLLYIAPDYADGTDSASSYEFVFDADTMQSQLDEALAG